jgi:hypothetical protein
MWNKGAWNFLRNFFAGATTEVLVGGGSGVDPVWTTATGSGAPVRAESPTLVTPTLGVATLTSANKVTVTAPATSATLTIIDGTVLSNANTITTHNTTEDVTAATMYRGNVHKITGAYTLSLPTAVVGYEAIFYASTVAVYSLDVKTGTDVIILNGTALAAGNKATSGGSQYNQMEVRCNTAGYYIINSIVGLAIDGGA